MALPSVWDAASLRATCCSIPNSQGFWDCMIEVVDSRRDAGTYYISIYKLRHRSDEPLVGCCSGWSDVSCHSRHWWYVVAMSDFSCHRSHWWYVVAMSDVSCHSRQWGGCRLPQSPSVRHCSHLSDVSCHSCIDGMLYAIGGGWPQSSLIGCWLPQSLPWVGYCNHWPDVSCHSRHWSDVKIGRAHV